jgi:hypothetical protein
VSIKHKHAMKVAQIICILLFVFSTQQTSFAQKWCEPGAEWVYWGCSMCPHDLVKTRYFHQKDTLIETRLCQKILMQLIRGSNCTDTINHERNSFFSYSMNDTVWFYVQNKFYPMYMFNAQVGDTHYLPKINFVWGDSMITTVVESTGFEIIDGDSLRSYTLKHIKGTRVLDTFSVTERFGIKNDRFIFWDLSDWTCSVPSWSLVCYFDDSIHFLDSKHQQSCEPCNPALNISEISVENKLQIYPNPADDFLTLKVEGFSINEIEIKDITGKIIVSKTISNFSSENKIDVQGLNTGVYLITVRLANNETITQKFVKN